jgi:hypothetical protein
MRARTLIVTASLAVTVAATAYFVMDPNAEFQKRWAAEKQVGARLRDPASAKFSQVSTIKVGDRPYAICGYVNGRNALGAYTGPRRFYLPLDHPQGMVLLPDESERGQENYSDAESMMDTLCSGDSDALMARAEAIAGIR